MKAGYLPMKTYDVEITDLAYDGKSVGAIDGKITFLDRGLPGETVSARLIKKKARHNVGRVQEILTKSPDRISAPCGHFEECGGCTWQDLDYNKQLFYKRKQVVDCLEHLGKFEAVDVAEAVPTREQFHYRNKMEFSLNRRDGDFTIGLHKRGHFDEIFDLDTCLLQSPVANDIVHWFRDFLKHHDIPVYNVVDHDGFVRFLMIRTARATGQIMLNIVTTEGDFPHVEKLVAEATARFPDITTMVQNINTKKSNIARGEREVVLHGDGFIVEKLFDYDFVINANSFFQTNTQQTETLYQTVFDVLAPKPEDRLLDLYCGTGSIGICASGRVADVIGIELEPTAIQAAEENARVNDIQNIRFHAGSVQDFLREFRDILDDRTAAVVDPPRAGLHPKALKGLCKLAFPRLVFVSCNPATFARDARGLVEAGYRMGKVIPVDMFPHTMHIELVAGFDRLEC